MKHIKKFESKEEDEAIDQSYVEMCFVDFIDEGNFRLRAYPHNRGFEIRIDVKKTSYVWKQDSIDFFKERAKSRLDFFSRVEECLSKIRIQYPNMKYRITDASSADYQDFRIELTTSKDFMKFNPTGWY